MSLIFGTLMKTEEISAAKLSFLQTLRKENTSGQEISEKTTGFRYSCSFEKS